MMDQPPSMTPAGGTGPPADPSQMAAMMAAMQSAPHPAGHAGKKRHGRKRHGKHGGKK